MPSSGPPEGGFSLTPYAMKHIVMTGGGITSWAAGKLVVQEHPPEDVVLLFADTKIEAPDVYRFLAESAINTEAELVMIADGRNPWEVFADERFIGNTRVDICSRILKRDMLDRWVSEKYSPDEVTCYVGMTADEELRKGRFSKLATRKLPYLYRAPLIEEGLTKEDALEWARNCGIAIPDMYAEGFTHANCGGGCVKQGHAGWLHLLKMHPERYRWWEEQELAWQKETGKRNTILRDRRNKRVRPLSLTELRERESRGLTTEDHMVLEASNPCGDSCVGI